MKIRFAQLVDAAQIAAIQVTAWHTAYSGLVPEQVLAGMNRPVREAAWIRALSKGQTSILVAEDDADVLGWSQFGSSRDPDADASVGEIYGMYVEPKAWRRGIGTALWYASKVELEAQRSSVTLWVLAANVQAREFYERCGFVVEPESLNTPDWLAGC